MHGAATAHDAFRHGFEPSRVAPCCTCPAIALYDAGRWADAAVAFERLIAQHGPGSAVAVPMLFSLGYCRLELEDARGSLLATTTFLDFSNRRHPFYWDAVNNTANAWHRLAAAEAVALYRTVIAARPHMYAFNGLALSLSDLGRHREAAWVLQQAKALGYWDDILNTSLAYVRKQDAGAPRETALTARPWARKRIIETSFRLLGYDRKARPARGSNWGL